ncbi:MULTISPECIES: hypothetical protein [unclassified Paenibacillus]|uniref:Aldolase n=2 Tax=Paenibacillus odorifer TaxID=189426 RepID=A0AB36JHB0_9BACL|nr:hypothetical protein BSK47_03620 [Paenibacillus odorifer]
MTDLKKDELREGENKMNSYRWMEVGRETIKVYLYVPHSFSGMIIDILTPFYEIVLDRQPAKGFWKLILASETLEEHERDLTIINVDMSNFHEPNRKFHVNSAGRTIYFEEPQEMLWKVQIAIRLVRDITRNEYLQLDMYYFHSAMVEYLDKGICIMGGKKSGKTSTVLTLLSSGVAGFISNDDLSIRIEDGRVIGYGWPRSIAVRNDTLEAIETMRNIRIGREELNHPNNKIPVREDSTFFYPKQLASIFKGRMKKKHKVDYVIFTQFMNEGKPRITELKDAAALELLSANYEHNINKYFKEFQIFFDQPDQKELEIVLKHIVKQAKCYELHQNFNMLDESRRLIDEVILNG